MRRLRFLVPPGSLRRGTGTRLVLPEEEGGHLGVTLRGAPGMIVHLFDGEGREWSAGVVRVERKCVELVLREEQTSPVEPPLRSLVLQAVSLDSIFEESIDQMTALGVSVIVPLLVERSKTLHRSPDEKRLERWRRIAREASKLSWRRVVPVIERPVTVEEILTGGGAPPRPSPSAITRSLLLDPGSPRGSLRASLAAPAPEEIRLAVGPEGGFTAAEQEDLAGAGFVSVSLGPRVLRTQNAGAAALALVMAAWGDIG